MYWPSTLDSRQVVEMCRSRLCDLYWVSTADPVHPGVDQVGQHEVDQSVVAAEGHRRLRPVRGSRPQPLALPAGQHDAQYVRRQRAGGRGLRAAASGRTVRTQGQRSERGHGGPQARRAGSRTPTLVLRRGPDHRCRTTIAGTDREARPSARASRCPTVHGSASACSPANPAPDVYGGAGVHVEHLVPPLGNS